MSTFTNLDWRRIDVMGIVTYSGLAAVDTQRHSKCHEWLIREGYEVKPLDCGQGLAHTIPELGKVLNWERQFGYALTSDQRNLDALRDGFTFPIPQHGGMVLELVRPDLAWQEDSRWLLGLLEIAQETTRRELAVGRRFLTLLVMPEKSPLIGQTITTMAVPGLYRSSARSMNEFEQ
jgi:hypothetical protein